MDKHTNGAGFVDSILPLPSPGLLASGSIFFSHPSFPPLPGALFPRSAPHIRLISPTRAGAIHREEIRMQQKTRSELFSDVIVQRDSAAGEASEQGADDLADYILDVLIPFIQDEMTMAALGETEEE